MDLKWFHNFFLFGLFFFIDEDTTTHQLEIALSTLALAARPILLASTQASQCNEISSYIEVFLLKCKTILVDAMFNTLLGLDTNDFSKMLATLQCNALSFPM